MQKNIIKITSLVSAMILALVSVTGSAYASGTETKRVCTQTTKYGGEVETVCKDEEVPVETLVETVVTTANTGVVENVAVVSTIAMAGFVLLIKAQREGRVQL